VTAVARLGLDAPAIPAADGEGTVVDLVVDLAHDLRSPVASILVLAESLQDGDAGPVTDLQRKQLGLIRSAAFCLCGVASDVLELARGCTPLVGDPISFSFREVFDTVRDLVAPLVEYKELELRFRGPEDDCRTGHPRALARALLNLTTNALKVTDRGYVEISATPIGQAAVEVAVRDTGPGLDTPNGAALYEPFRRESPDQRPSFSSFGIGLRNCRNLVAAMGSELEVESRKGVGSRFFFTLDLPTA
jgi:signal transduction histidine kinase